MVNRSWTDRYLTALLFRTGLMGIILGYLLMDGMRSSPALVQEGESECLWTSPEGYCRVWELEYRGHHCIHWSVRGDDGAMDCIEERDKE